MSRRTKWRDDSVVTIAIGHDQDTVADAEREEPEALWRRILSVSFTIAVVAFAIYLWPAMLGGSTRLVVVSGHSMEPTYDLRDIVVARDAGDTQVGDIVVFEVPEGEAKGMLIIHRVLEVDEDGLFITQGDNRDTPDQWALTEENIVGKPLAHIPKAGKLLGLIQNIWVIALLVGLVVLFLLWPDDDEADLDDDQDDEADESRIDESALVIAAAAEPELIDVGRLGFMDETDAFERDAAWTLVDTPSGVEVASMDEQAKRWLDAELNSSIDDEVMVDAVAWLDEQLAGMGQPIDH